MPTRSESLIVIHSARDLLTYGIILVTMLWETYLDIELYSPSNIISVSSNLTNLMDFIIKHSNLTDPCPHSLISLQGPSISPPLCLPGASIESLTCSHRLSLQVLSYSPGPLMVALEASWECHLWLPFPPSPHDNLDTWAREPLLRSTKQTLK